MLLLVEICAALAGLAVVAMAVAAFRAVHVLERTSRRVVELTGEMHRWIAEAGELTREARDTMVSVQAVVVPLRRAAERLETVGGHAAALSTAALDEIGPFLRAALALTRGMKSGTTYLMKQLDQRIMQGRFATHGGSEHD